MNLFPRISRRLKSNSPAPGPRRERHASVFETAYASIRDSSRRSSKPRMALTQVAWKDEEEKVMVRRSNRDSNISFINFLNGSKILKDRSTKGSKGKKGNDKGDVEWGVYHAPR